MPTDDKRDWTAALFGVIAAFFVVAGIATIVLMEVFR